jgi:transcriptional regulator with XRE-family HTH domain
MRVARLLKTWRVIANLGIREVAKEIGVSPATLSRIERGEEMNGQTLAKVIMWMLGQPKS